jgi:hypothetical protein
MLKIGIVTVAILLGMGVPAPAAAPGKATVATGKGGKPGAGKATPEDVAADKAEPAEDGELETGEAIDAAAAEKVAPPAEQGQGARAGKAAKVASKAAPKGQRPAGPRAAPADRSAPPVAHEAAAVAPSLSAPALQKELGGHRPATGETGSERERLEVLSADLARARAALLAETGRLEAMMRKGLPARPGGSPAGQPGAGDPGAPTPMPIGDPMLPPPRSQYLVPAPAAGQVDIVSKAVKGMKPEQAAALIAHLDRTLAADVLQRMKPADAGAVLGFLRPEMGAALATEIANRPATNSGKGKPGQKEKL